MDYKLGNCQIYLATVSCPKDKDYNSWQTLLHDIAKAIGLTPSDWTCQYYPGGGITVIWMLSESHITVDTYPEHGLADLTLVSCKTFNAEDAVKVINKDGLVVQQQTVLQKRFDHKWRAF